MASHYIGQQQSDITGEGEWCVRAGEQSPRGNKIHDKINNLDEKSNFLRLINYKLFSQIEAKLIINVIFWSSQCLLGGLLQAPREQNNLATPLDIPK